MSSLPLPPFTPRPQPRQAEDEKRRWAKWFQVDNLLAGVELAGGVALIMWAFWQLFQLAALPLPIVPTDGARLERIEALAQRASTIAEANQRLIVIFVTVATGGLMAGIALRDVGKSTHERRLNEENEELRARIDELEDQIMTEAERELDEASAERKRITASVVGALFARRPSRFEADDEDGDESDSPFSPPKPKPPYFN